LHHNQLSSKGFAWIKAENIPSDLNGPISTPFLPLPANLEQSPIFSIIEDIAQRYPHSIAVTDGIEHLTYEQLIRRAIALASYVEDVEPNGAVALLLPHSLSTLIGILACLACGRIGIILDANDPPERNERILGKANVKAVVVHRPDNPAAAIASSVRLITLPSNGEGFRRHQSTPRGPDEPALVIYTSGSTGEPKGIVRSQHDLLRRIRHRINKSHYRPDDCSMSLSLLNTGTGLTSCLTALVTGGRYVICSVASTGMRTAMDMLALEKVTLLIAVPAVLRTLLSLDGAKSAFSSVRVIKTNSEQLLNLDVEHWHSVIPPSCYILIGYGLTEVAPLTSWFVPKNWQSKETRLPVGYLATDYEFAILNEQSQSADYDEPGELWVRGEAMSLGEWQDGQCVPGRLMKDPENPHFTILRTGDWVRRRKDGLIEFVGRRDGLVKIRGQRVELAEVEHAIRRSASVRDVVVVPRGEADKVALVAFLVGKTVDAGQSLVDEVRAHSREALPSFMQPSRFVLMKELPRLPGGKIDRLALLRHKEVDFPDSVGALPNKRKTLVELARRLSSGLRARK
jgi:acyl-coenzyme A synthetase/AMP-(fatty) acid ligase